MAISLRSSHFLLLPGALVGGATAFYLVAWLLGYTPAELSAEMKAAFEALLSLGIPAIDDEMTKRYMDDSFLRSLSSQAFMKRAQSLVPALERLYRAKEGESLREDILEMTGSIEGKGAEAFLRSVIDDAASPLRRELEIA